MEDPKPSPAEVIIQKSSLSFIFVYTWRRKGRRNQFRGAHHIDELVIDWALFVPFSTFFLPNSTLGIFKKHFGKNSRYIWLQHLSAKIIYMHIEAKRRALMPILNNYYCRFMKSGEINSSTTADSWDTTIPDSGVLRRLQFTSYRFSLYQSKSVTDLSNVWGI